MARQFVLVLALALTSLSARADPVLMFLIGFAQNLIDSSASSKPAKATARAALPTTYPGTMVQPEHLQRLIDDCFTYLSQDQRAEIFEQLNAELLKPGNTLIAGDMVRFFAQTALQVRALQVRLGQLSAAEKEVLAVEFGRALLLLSPQERPQIERIVELRQLPLPPDIGDLFAAQVARNQGSGAQKPLPAKTEVPSGPQSLATPALTSELALRVPR